MPLPFSFFYLLVFIPLNLRNKKTIRVRKISSKWNIKEKEKPLPSGCVLYREATLFVPNQAVQFRVREIITLCLDAPLEAFILFSYNFGNGDCEEESKRLIHISFVSLCYRGYFLK